MPFSFLKWDRKYLFEERGCNKKFLLAVNFIFEMAKTRDVFQICKNDLRKCKNPSN